MDTGIFNCKNQLLKTNPLSVNPTNWSNTLKQIVGNSQWLFLSVFDHFVALALIRSSSKATEVSNLDINWK